MGGKIVIDGSSWIPISTIVRAYINPTIVRLATVEGIGGLSIARLADAVGMSKSVLFGHFGSRRSCSSRCRREGGRTLRRPGDRAGVDRVHGP
jgi:hypothetical protein